MSSWWEKLGNTLADFTPVGWGSRLLTGKGAVSAAKGLVGAAAGQNDQAVPLEQIPFAADADNQLAAKQAASVNAAQIYQDNLSGKNGNFAQYWAQTNPPPHVITDEEIRAEQVKNDRARILGQASQQYGGLISGLQGEAFGDPNAGYPSAAQSTLQAATDRNNRMAYGMAASAQGTGGQRAALFGAALGQSAMQNQSAANDAATLRAQETQQAKANQIQARTQLGQAIGDQTNAYNTLYSGDTDQQNSNLEAAISHDTGEAQRASSNASNKGAAIRGLASAAGSYFGHTGGG